MTIPVKQLHVSQVTNSQAELAQHAQLVPILLAVRQAHVLTAQPIPSLVPQQLHVPIGLLVRLRQRVQVHAHHVHFPREQRA